MTVSALQHKPDDYQRMGIAFSIVGHLIIGYFIFVGVLPNMGELSEPVVYSVSIEGGKTLGGASQVPKDNKPSEVAPMKNVAAEQSQELKVKPEQIEDAQVPVEDAEVSVAEPKPTAKPTPKPTAKATPKPSAKPTAAPSKKTDTKSDPKQTKKSDGEDVDKRLQAALQRYLGESSEGGGKGFGAARVGGQGMGGGVVRPPEFFVYEKLLRSRIKDAWRWYDTNASLITQVSFEIEPDGMVKNVRLVKGSGDGNFDESVMRAVMKASPLPRPPESVYELYFKSVRITFDPRD